MKNKEVYYKFVSQVKSSQVKSSPKIVSLIALLSFVFLFLTSCNNAYAPNDDIPAVLGYPYSLNFGSSWGGNLTRSNLQVSPETSKNIAVAEGILPKTYYNDFVIYGTSANLKINTELKVNAPMSTIENAQIYKYTEGYEDCYNARVDTATVKSYIRFKGPDDALITEYIVALTTNGISMRATYTATLSFTGPIH